MDKNKLLNTLMNWIPAIILIILVLTLQYQGYYNKVYYSVSDCDGYISVRKTNAMEWNKAYDYVKEHQTKFALTKSDVENNETFVWKYD